MKNKPLLFRRARSVARRPRYRHQLDDVISPRWGSLRLSEVKPVAVEKWLNEMPVAPGSRYKTKGVMSVLFQHAMRYEWTDRNPIRLVRQSAMPTREEIALEPFEIEALLSELREPFRTLILLASVTGLRRGELFGLKWEDIDFAEAEIRIVRSIVDQVEGPPKTLASRRPIPMSSELALALENWRKDSEYSKPADWVFASPFALGKLPYWPDAVLKRHILPAAHRAGITKRIGWHSFRRTLATLLQSSGASVKTTQELLRHASPGITMGIYAKAVTADKRQAQETIAALFVGNTKQSEPTANVATT
jgi:integrase